MRDQALGGSRQTGTEGTNEVLGKVGDTSFVVVARADVKVDADGRRLGVRLVLLE